MQIGVDMGVCSSDMQRSVLDVHPLHAYACYPLHCFDLTTYLLGEQEMYLIMWHVGAPLNAAAPGAQAAPRRRACQAACSSCAARSGT